MQIRVVFLMYATAFFVFPMEIYKSFMRKKKRMNNKNIKLKMMYGVTLFSILTACVLDAAPRPSVVLQYTSTPVLDRRLHQNNHILNPTQASSLEMLRLGFKDGKKVLLTDNSSNHTRASLSGYYMGYYD